MNGSNIPLRSCAATVQAPFACPDCSDLNISSPSKASLTATAGPRRPSSWTSRAVKTYQCQDSLSMLQQPRPAAVPHRSVAPALFADPTLARARRTPRRPPTRSTHLMRRPQLTGSSAGLRNRSGFDDNLKKPRICWDNHGALRVTTGPKTAGRTRNGWRYSAPDALPRTLPPPAFSPGAEGHRFESCGPRQFSRPFSSKTRVSATALADDGALAPAFEPDSPEPVRAGQNTAGGTTRSSSIDPPTTPPVSDRTIRPRRLGVFLAHARGRPHNRSSSASRPSAGHPSVSVHAARGWVSTSSPPVDSRGQEFPGPIRY